MPSDPTALRRSDFEFRQSIPTRWNDNDMLGHVNNVVYYSYFEVLVVDFEMNILGLDWGQDRLIPFTAQNTCRFLKALAFPEVLEGGLRVAKLGTTSVTFELAIFRDGEDSPAAVGSWVHVWVDRNTEQPQAIPDDHRQLLARYAAPGS